MRGKVRGRFDIVVPFEDGAYLRITSHKTRSLPAAEIAACLREYAGYIENGIQAKALKRADDGTPKPPPRGLQGSA